MSFRRHWRTNPTAVGTFTAGILDLVFPRHCIGCGEGVDGDSLRWICAGCAEELHVVREPCCRTCGYPFYGQLEGLRVCGHCAHLSPVFSEGMTLLLHRGVGRSLVKELKYHQGTYLVEDLLTLAQLRPGLTSHLDGGVLVPVPLHPHKERERGFNQSRILAEAFSRRYQLAVAPVLERTRNTVSQTQLSREERLKNMKNAFVLGPGAALDETMKYILVDDVFTTGATLNAAAAALRTAGAGDIRVLTMAHG